MRIRFASIDEAQALSGLALRSKAHWGYSEQFMLACREELKISSADISAPTQIHRVAEDNGRRLGFYALVHISNTRAELDALFVEPHLIGRGVGRQLMADCHQQASLAGVTQIIVQGDPNAEAFYRKIGGTPSGYRESASVPGRLLPTFTIDVAGPQERCVAQPLHGGS